MYIRPRSVAASVALASLLLAGCSGSESTDTASTAPPTTPEAAATTTETAAPTADETDTPSEPMASESDSVSDSGELADVYAAVEQSINESSPEELADLCDGLDLFGAEAIVNMALGSAGEDAPENLDSERLAAIFEDACANAPEPNETATDGGEESPGSGQAAKIGETQTVGDYEVTLVAFDKDATDAVMAMNDFNEPPSNGAYATAEFEVTYIGDTEGDPGFELKFVVVADSRQIAGFDGECITERPAFDMGTLENGGTADFVECYDVDPETIERMFVEDTLSFDDAGRATWNVS